MRASLHFGADALGLALSLYYLGAASASVPFGRLAEAVGGVRVMRVAALGAAGLLILVAGAVHSWAMLAGTLFAAGVVSAAIQPATNLFLARRIPAGRQGTAFGIKQAAIPFAALLGGLAVPGIALSVGWRWAFVAAAALAVGAAASVPKPATTLVAYRAKRPAAGPRGARLPLMVLGVGFGLGIFAATGLTAFLVTSAVAAGLSEANAGFIAALGGAVAVAARVATGILADRRGRGHLPVVAGMLVFGVVGFVALSAGSAAHQGWLFLTGAVVAYGAGWGWNGLFNFAIVRTHMNAPARATAITQVGGRLSGVAGPLAFGLIVAHSSYAEAWLIDGAAALAGAAVILFGRHMLMATSSAPA